MAASAFDRLEASVAGAGASLRGGDGEEAARSSGGSSGGGGGGFSFPSRHQLSIARPISGNDLGVDDSDGGFSLDRGSQLSIARPIRGNGMGSNGGSGSNVGSGVGGKGEGAARAGVGGGGGDDDSGGSFSLNRGRQLSITRPISGGGGCGLDEVEGCAKERVNDSLRRCEGRDLSPLNLKCLALYPRP